MITLVYYGSVLKSYNTENEFILSDDQFQRVDEELEIRQVAEIQEMTVPSNVSVKKEILRSQMIESVDNLKKSNFDSSIVGGMDDTESTYSNTTRNTNNMQSMTRLNSTASDNMSSHSRRLSRSRQQSRVYSPFKPQLKNG